MLCPHPPSSPKKFEKNARNEQMKNSDTFFSNGPAREQQIRRSRIFLIQIPIPIRCVFLFASRHTNCIGITIAAQSQFETISIRNAGGEVCLRWSGAAVRWKPMNDKLIPSFGRTTKFLRNNLENLFIPLSHGVGWHRYHSTFDYFQSLISLFFLLSVTHKWATTWSFTEHGMLLR